MPYFTEPTQLRAVRVIAVEQIRPNRNQPRAQFVETELAELADSIQRHGVLQPLIVAVHEGGGYELIAGERRWRAAQQAGLTEVPVLVQSATPLELLELALVENIQRADLNPLEEAQAYEALRRDFQLNDDEIARRVGKSRVAVVNTRRLLRLDRAAQQALLANEISAGHGRALLRFEAQADQQIVLQTLRERGWSVRELERLSDLAQQSGLAADARLALLQGRVTAETAQLLLTLSEPSQQAQVLELLNDEVLSQADLPRLCALVNGGLSLDAARERLNGRGQPVPDRPAPAAAARAAEPRRTERSDEADLATHDRDLMRRLELQLQTPVQIERRG